MVTLDRIRLTGLLPESPHRGALPFRLGVRPLLALVAVGSAAAATAAAAPGPRAPIPATPGKLASALVETKQDLNSAIDAWRATRATAPPEDVTLNALYEQRIELTLARRPELSRAVVPRLPGSLALEVQTNLAAKRELWRLTPKSHRHRFATGRALPPATLLSYYRAAQRRFGVRWSLLAAVNFVETAFNKLRNESATGAQGPMQFMPATWRAYGLGGNVHDPRDARLGAANYLQANGAPQANARALYHYNPSPLYVRAVLRYERRIRTDPRAFYDYYAWQVYVRTPAGLRRITGPGLRR
jgi:membrane-bound lytic murein transglycosylase B